MTEQKKIERLAENIKRIVNNPIGIYRGREELRLKVINGTVASALTTIKKK